MGWVAIKNRPFVWLKLGSRMYCPVAEGSKTPPPTAWLSGGRLFDPYEKTDTMAGSRPYCYISLEVSRPRMVRTSRGGVLLGGMIPASAGSCQTEKKGGVRPGLEAG
jgi:hypothetical protein